ncbi:MAG: hypothetical protein HXY34_00790 [Candidatus Thorarchaeota archaeon]|nr:hypothetical protein [Candidatus Thorarchaeota archaeon]
MRARIELCFQLEEEAERVAEALLPDNTPLPSGLELNVQVHGKCVRFELSTSRGLESLRATIEDILSASDLSIRTLQSINWEEPSG